MGESSILNEIAEFASKRGYNVEARGNVLRIIHPDMDDLGLVIREDDGTVYIELLQGEELRDSLDDLIQETDRETVEEYIREDILSDLESLASNIEALCRARGLRVENRVREGILDVLEILEDIAEY